MYYCSIINSSLKKSKIKFSSDSLLAISLLVAMMIAIFPVTRIHGHLSPSQSNINLEKIDLYNFNIQDEIEIPKEDHENQVKIKSDFCTLCDFIFCSNYIGSIHTANSQIPQMKDPDYIPEEELVPFSELLNCFNKGSPNFC